ncbi:Imm6 family immunity protein [Clostridium sp. JS66]|uniref:Imm6 family immunity protein n=1 Tax=Clostridium sp. JS66 TaxID=3064705 RepID=UPI00298D7630|nr:Imm6 family immunity protein [Clostridium sp. JS66]WPC43914.1 Imm6 family immunity protein [Clostridium sp. JS66]
MIINLDGICENGKVAVALIMSEITLDSIEQHNTEYKFCRDAIDMCWQWLECSNVNKYEICNLIANDSICLADITCNIEDDKLGNKYGTIQL